MRWEDDLKLTARHNCRNVAHYRTHWRELEEAYAKRHAELRDIFLCIQNIIIVTNLEVENKTLYCNVYLYFDYDSQVQ